MKYTISKNWQKVLKDCKLSQTQSAVNLTDVIFNLMDNYNVPTKIEQVKPVEESKKDGADY